MNFDAFAEPETSHIPAVWKDAWVLANPDSNGFTWQPYDKQA